MLGFLIHETEPLPFMKYGYWSPFHEAAPLGMCAWPRDRVEALQVSLLFSFDYSPHFLWANKSAITIF